MSVLLTILFILAAGLCIARHARLRPARLVARVQRRLQR
jgi:hypothetical protein